MGQGLGDHKLYFPIRLRCATVADVLTNPELEDALARALGRAFARARAALPAAVVVGDGVVLQPPQLMKGDLSTNDTTALLARVSRAIEAAARAQALPLHQPRAQQVTPVDSAALLAQTPEATATPTISEIFDPQRYDPETNTYDIPSYRDGGTLKGMKIQPAKQKRPRISPTDKIKEEVREKIQGQLMILDKSFISDRAFIAAWRRDLVLWTYSNYYTQKKPPKASELQKIYGSIEKTIVLPVMAEQFHDFYEKTGVGVSDPQHSLALAPEFEYAGMPPKVRKAIGGGLSGWLQIRDEIAASLVPKMRSNLLRFYDMTPNGKMAEAKVWPGEEGVIVHEDLLPVLKSVASSLENLVPLLEVKYIDFWKHHGAQGLQIRPISGSKRISQHALGKAVDIASHYNPHLTERRILTIIRLLGEIESMKNIRKYGRRHVLLERQRKDLLEKKDMSKGFQDFLLEANKRYQEWIDAQEKFKSNFPEVKRGTDRRVALKKVVQRVEEERDVVKLKLDEVENTLKKAAEALDQAKQHQKSLEDERKQLRESLSKPRKKQQGTGETQAGMTLSEARDKLKKLDGSLREAKKAVAQANQEHDRISKEYNGIKKEEYEFLNKLIEDLIGDDDLLFSEGTNADKAVTEKVSDEPLLFGEEVTDPGLAVIREKGYLSIPWEVVKVFLENGFDWGGLWAHPDFMHFEWAGKVRDEFSEEERPVGE